MAFSFSDRTRDLIVQSFLIVLSVLLALFLDEVRTDYKQAQQRDQVVANVVAELQDNAESLDLVMGHHQTAAQKLSTYLDSLEQAGRRIEQAPIRVLTTVVDDGIREPTLQRTAWEAAQFSAAYDLLPYDTVYRFSRLYDLQDYGVETMWQHLGGLMIRVDAQKPAEALAMLRAFQFSFAQLHSQEEFLLQETQALIDEVCAESSAPTCEAA